MLQRSATISTAGDSHLNLDNIVLRIKSLTERQKLLLAYITAGKDAEIAESLRIKESSAKAQINPILRELEIPYGPFAIRLLFLRAAGLKAIGRTEEAEAILVSLPATFPKEVKPRRCQTPATASRIPRKATAPNTDFSNKMLGALPRLRGFAISLCGNNDRADDLVQETALRALDYRESFKDGSNMDAWLFTILRNIFRSEYRRRRREVEDADDSYAKTLKIQPNQESLIEFQEFRVALDKLNQDMREALVLVGASGFSYEDAALITNCVAGTIKSRVNRARMTLKRLLGLDEFAAYGCGPDDMIRAVINTT